MSASPIALSAQPGLFDDVLLTRKETAKLLKCSVASLERWALNGSGPPFCRLGKNKKRAPVRYRLADIETYLLATRVAATSPKN